MQGPPSEPRQGACPRNVARTNRGTIRQVPRPTPLSLLSHHSSDDSGYGCDRAIACRDLFLDERPEYFGEGLSQAIQDLLGRLSLEEETSLRRTSPARPEYPAFHRSRRGDS